MNLAMNSYEFHCTARQLVLVLLLMSVCFSGSLPAYFCIQLLLSLFVLCCAGK